MLVYELISSHDMSVSKHQTHISTLPSFQGPNEPKLIKGLVMCAVDQSAPERSRTERFRVPADSDAPRSGLISLFQESSLRSNPPADLSPAKLPRRTPAPGLLPPHIYPANGSTLIRNIHLVQQLCDRKRHIKAESNPDFLSIIDYDHRHIMWKS